MLSDGATNLIQHKDRGIRYNLEGNHPADGLAQAGFVVSWFGGPLL
jgi:hypothetical protein